MKLLDQVIKLRWHLIGRRKLKNAYCNFVSDTVPKSYLEGDFFHGIEMIMDSLRKTNGFVQSQKPWKLAKEADTVSQSKVNIVLHISMEVLRISALLLQPVIPNTTSQLLDKLGIKDIDRSWQNLQCFSALKSKSGHDRDDQTLGMGSYVLYSRRKAEC